MYTTALFSEAQVDIRSQTDEGGVDDAKTGNGFALGIAFVAMVKAQDIKNRDKYKAKKKTVIMVR